MPYQGRIPAKYPDTNYKYTLEQGSVDFPTLSFLNDSNNGLWSPAADNIAISTDGSERLRITLTGNIGIGTTTPTDKLSVNGYITESTDSGTNYWNVVTQQDIGTAANQVPLNQYLGSVAYLDNVSNIFPSVSAPTDTYTINFEYVSDTSIKIRMKGSDGVVRSTTLTLS